jgi:predicted metal-binding protein
MARIAIVSCQKIKDVSCIGCLKCFKAMALKEGEFNRYGDDLEVVAMSDCGDCPGLVMPKLSLVKDVAHQYDRDFDIVHLGTCVVKAVHTAACPINLDKLKGMIENVLGKQVVVGTHTY